MTISYEENQGDPRPARRFFHGLRRARRAMRISSARAAAVETSNGIFNEVLFRAVADLYMLMTDTEYGVLPYAGIPWYSTPFGRDAIISSSFPVTRTCAGFPSSSAVCGGRRATVRRSILWPAFHRRGPAPRRSPCWRPASASGSIFKPSRFASGDRACRTSSTRSLSGRCRSAGGGSTSSCAATPPTCRSMSCAALETPRSRSCSRVAAAGV